MKNIHVANLEDKIVDIGQDIITEDLESLEMKAQFLLLALEGVKDL